MEILQFLKRMYDSGSAEGVITFQLPQTYCKIKDLQIDGNKGNSMLTV